MTDLYTFFASPNGKLCHTGLVTSINPSDANDAVTIEASRIASALDGQVVRTTTNPAESFFDFRGTPFEDQRYKVIAATIVVDTQRIAIIAAFTK